MPKKISTPELERHLLKIAQHFSAGLKCKLNEKSRQGRKKMRSFNSCLMHCVFSTTERRPWLTPTIRDRLWPYLGGIARENNMKALAIGGVADHVHLLVSLPATLSVSKAVQLLKGNSSKWLRETFPELRSQEFAWQEGFGRLVSAFRASMKQLNISRRRKSITGRKVFMRNGKRFLRSMVTISIRAIELNFCRP